MNILGCTTYNHTPKVMVEWMWWTSHTGSTPSLYTLRCISTSHGHKSITLSKIWQLNCHFTSQSSLPTHDNKGAVPSTTTNSQLVKWSVIPTEWCCRTRFSFSDDSKWLHELQNIRTKASSPKLKLHTVIIETHRDMCAYTILHYKLLLLVRIIMVITIAVIPLLFHCIR